MHAWERQHRAGLGDSLPGLGALEVRLFERFRDPWMPRTVLSEWRGPSARKVRASSSRVDAAPNAPLLKRVVRRPYRLDTERGRRAVHREAVPWEELRRESTPSASSMVFAARTRIAFDNPLRSQDNSRPVDLHHQSVVGWLRARRVQLAAGEGDLETGGTKR